MMTSNFKQSTSHSSVAIFQKQHSMDFKFYNICFTLRLFAQCSDSQDRYHQLKQNATKTRPRHPQVEAIATTVVITNWVTVAKYHFFNKQSIFFSFKQIFYFLYHLQDFSLTIRVIRCVSYKERELPTIREPLGAPRVYLVGLCCCYFQFFVLCLLFCFVWCLVPNVSRVFGLSIRKCPFGFIYFPLNLSCQSHFSSELTESFLFLFYFCDLLASGSCAQHPFTKMNTTLYSLWLMF